MGFRSLETRRPTQTEMRIIFLFEVRPKSPPLGGYTMIFLRYLRLRVFPRESGQLASPTHPAPTAPVYPPQLHPTPPTSPLPPPPPQPSLPPPPPPHPPPPPRHPAPSPP